MYDQTVSYTVDSIGIIPKFDNDKAQTNAIIAPLIFAATVYVCSK